MSGLTEQQPFSLQARIRKTPGLPLRLTFIIAGAIWWRETVIMAVTAVIGGYVGAVVGKRLDPGIVRGLTIGLSISVTIIFFVRSLG